MVFDCYYYYCYNTATIIARTTTLLPQYTFGAYSVLHGTGAGGGGGATATATTLLLGQY